MNCVNTTLVLVLPCFCLLDELPDQEIVRSTFVDECKWRSWVIGVVGVVGV
jgi:hypothetical protein